MPNRKLKFASVLVLLISSFFGRAQQSASNRAEVRIPMIGCKSDGQLGPLGPPRASTKAIRLTSEDASQLAYYKAKNGFGAFGPRGWQCFSTYGSNGSNLFISPEPINSKDVLASDWKGFSGPAIQVSISFGDTSGRFAVATTIARVFPDRMSFVRGVASEGVEGATSFPTGPYPADKLRRRGATIVEFETPPRMNGLGTQSRLAIDSDPIQGVAILVGKSPDLVQLSMRLPRAYQTLSSLIVERLEADVAAFKAETKP